MKRKKGGGDNIPMVEGSQMEEIPRRHYQRRVLSDQGHEIPINEIDVSRPMLSQPMEMPLRGESVQSEPERMEIEEMKKDIREKAERIVEENRQELIRKLYGITEDDQQYTIEKEAKHLKTMLSLQKITQAV